MSINARRLQKTATAKKLPPPSPSNITFTPGLLALSEPEIANSGRGQLEWLGVPPDPSWWPTVDIYRRNPWEINWNTIETSQGVYDFTMIDNLIDEAVVAGGRVHFRFMTWFYINEQTRLVPSYVPLQNTTNFLPDWNSEAYLKGWENLWLAIAEKYNDDPRIGYIDIGGFGAWGEWFFDDSWGNWATETSAARICDAVINAMTKKYIIAPAPALTPNTPGDNYGFRYAVNKSDRVGWRFDNVGAQEVDLSGTFWTQREQETWKRAPVVAEWGPSVTSSLPRTYIEQGVDNTQKMHLSTISSSNRPNQAYGPNGEYNYQHYDTMSPTDKSLYANMMKTLGYRLSLTSASMQTNIARGSSMTVTTNWHNEGVAPTYDPWNVQLVLMNGLSIAWQGSLGVVLKTILHGDRQFTSTITLPNLSGEFTLGIRATDPANYLPPLKLANTGRTSDGIYPLGEIRLI